MDGAEVGANTNDSTWRTNAGWIPNTTGGTLPTRDTSVFRSGAASYKVDSGATGNPTYLDCGVTALASTVYYLRAYLRTTTPPTTSCKVLGSINVTAPSVNMLTDGTLVLMVNSVQQGSPSISISDGSFHRVELMVTIGSTAATQTAAELRVDGVTVATWSGSVSASAGFNVGWAMSGSGPGTSKVMYVDDLALNDNSGTAQNSWCGEGNEILLVPISDNARGTNWVGGAGGTTSLFAAVDNIPPAGLASGTNTSQIHNVTKDTTGNYDANLMDYTTAGVPAGATISVVFPFWNLSGAATGDLVQIVSNPAGASASVSPGGTPGAWPTGWSWQQPSACNVYNPSVTLGTSPVIRIGKRVNSTNEVACDFMGMYVEYSLPSTPKSGTDTGSNAGEAIVVSPKGVGETGAGSEASNLGKPFDQLVDAFNSALDKVGTWPGSSAGAAWDAGNGGQAKIPCSSGYDNIGTGYQGVAYNLVGSSVLAQITLPADGTGTRELFMRVTPWGLDSNLYRYEMYYSGGALFARRITNGTTDYAPSSISIDRVNHKWWRIREASGTVYFDTSPDGFVWTNRFSCSVVTSVSRCYINFLCGYYGTETADNGYVDSVNIPPTLVTASDLGGIGGAVFSTPILDNFNRADQTHPMTGWTPWISSGLQVSSNQMAPMDTGDNASYFSTAMGGPDVEVYITEYWSPINGGESMLACRLDPSTGGDGTFYKVSRLPVAGQDTFAVDRCVAGVYTNIGTFNCPEFTNGQNDQFGMRVYGSTIEVWYKLYNGSWTLAGRITDTTIPGTGNQNKFGFYEYGNVDAGARWDDFGGGMIVVGSESGAVSIPATAVTGSDANGTGAETVAELAQIPSNDSGTSSPQTALVALLPSSDINGATVEATLETVQMPSSDTGAGSEQTPTIMLYSSEAGLGSEGAGMLYAVFDAGVGAEAPLPTVVLLVPDSGAGSDTSVAAIPPTPIAGADSGAGISDLSALLSQILGTDAGAGSEPSAAPPAVVSNLTAGVVASNPNSTNTAVVTPTANALQLLAIAADTSTTTVQPPVPTVTGCGLTWVQVGTQVDYDNAGSGRGALFLFRAMGPSPVSGAITIDFGTPITRFSWVLDQMTNVDTSGTNGSGAVVQVVGNSALSGGTLTDALAPFADSVNDIAWGAFAVQQLAANTMVFTPGTGFTKSGESVTQAITIASEYQKGDFDPSMSWTNNGSIFRSGVIGVEVKAAPVTSPLTARIPGTDNGAGAETASPLFQFTAVDSGSGVDVAALLSLLAVSDLGNGTDNASVIQGLVTVFGTDNGAGSESVARDAQIAANENGSSVETALLLRALAVVDAATDSEAAVLVVTISQSDSGSGVEAGNAVIFQPGSDSGTGSDLLSAINHAVVDSGLGSEQIARALAVFEQGTGTEVAIPQVVMFVSPDSGAGSDASVTIIAVIPASDNGGSIQNAVLALYGIETAAGSEAASLLAAVADRDDALADDLADMLSIFFGVDIGLADDIAKKATGTLLPSIKTGYVSRTDGGRTGRGHSGYVARPKVGVVE